MGTVSAYLKYKQMVNSRGWEKNLTVVDLELKAVMCAERHS